MVGQALRAASRPLGSNSRARFGARPLPRWLTGDRRFGWRAGGVEDGTAVRFEAGLARVVRGSFPARARELHSPSDGSSWRETTVHTRARQEMRMTPRRIMDGSLYLHSWSWSTPQAEPFFFPNRPLRCASPEEVRARPRPDGVRAEEGRDVDWSLSPRRLRLRLPHRPTIERPETWSERSASPPSTWDHLLARSIRQRLRDWDCASGEGHRTSTSTATDLLG